MNINQVVCIRSNWFAEIKTDNNRWAPANEIVICALAPPTTGEPGSSLKKKNSKGTPLFWQESTTKDIVYM